jgi:hypothetical protein
MTEYQLLMTQSDLEKPWQLSEALLESGISWLLLFVVD